MKSCAIIGHRKIAFSDELRQKIKRMIIYLILNENVDIFRFSSRSQFVDVVWEIVSYLQETTFPYIKMVAYDCKNELSILTKDKEKTENLYANFFENAKTCYFDEIVESKHYLARKNTYIARNYQLIDDSEICLFYYDENYYPKMQRYSKKSCIYYQPNSGTKLAYKYAIKNNRKVFNIFTSENIMSHE